MNQALLVILIVTVFLVIYWILIGERKFKEKLEGK